MSETNPQEGSTTEGQMPIPPAPGTDQAPTVTTPPGAPVPLADAVVNGTPASTLAPKDQADLFTKADSFYKSFIGWMGGLKEDVREKVQDVASKAGHRWREAIHFVITHADGAEKALEALPGMIEGWAKEDAAMIKDDVQTAPEMDALAKKIQDLEKTYNLEAVHREVNLAAPLVQQKVFLGRMATEDGADPIPEFRGVGLDWTEALADLEKQLEKYEAAFKK